MMQLIVVLSLMIGGISCDGFKEFEQVEFLANGSKFYVQRNKLRETNCTLQINTKNFNKTFNYTVDKLSEELLTYYNKKIELNGMNCGASVHNVNVSDTGFWKFEDTKCFIHVTKKIFVYKHIFAIRAFENYYVLPSLPGNLNNITACYLVHDSSENKKRVYNMFNNNLKGFELIEQCGARFKANAKTKGDWAVIAIIGDELTIKMPYYISYKEKENNLPIQNKTILRGSTSEELMSKTERIIECIIIDPHGETKTTITNGGLCSYRIPTVTLYHNGIWTFRYYYDSKPDYEEHKMNVSVADIQDLKVNVNYSKDKIIIMCNATEKYKINSCKFETPSKQIINMFLGISYEKYEYYGDSYGNSYDVQECGIAIYNYTKSDLGMWKCLITTIDEKPLSALVYVGDEIKKINISKEIPNKIYVKQGHPFKIKCGVNRRLSYCWLRSPNGTIYHIANSKTSTPNTLLYYGSGLSMGECGANLLNSKKQYDQGDWSCHMGIANGADVMTKVSVIVTDSTAVAVEKKVTILSDSKAIQLSCKATFNSYFENNYCVWTHNNELFMENYDNRYQIKSNKTMCSLTIQDEDLYRNVGEWSCIVMNKNGKQQASIEVIYESKLFATNVTLTTICAIFTLIACFLSIYFLYKFFKKHSSDDTLNLVQNVEPISNIKSNNFYGLHI